jgi:hypothetical protein
MYLFCALVAGSKTLLNCRRSIGHLFLIWMFRVTVWGWVSADRVSALTNTQHLLTWQATRPEYFVLLTRRLKEIPQRVPLHSQLLDWPMRTCDEWSGVGTHEEAEFPVWGIPLKQSVVFSVWIQRADVLLGLCSEVHRWNFSWRHSRLIVIWISSTVLTKTCRWSLSCAGCTQFTPSSCMSVTFGRDILTSEPSQRSLFRGI